MNRQTEAIRSDFNAENYLQARDRLLPFTMVEFGHNGRPVAHQQREFTGQRAYIGVEAWLRDPYCDRRSHVNELEVRSGDQDIRYIEIDTGVVIKRPYKIKRGLVEHIGGYDPATSLPDKLANEVFAGNVFGDPVVGGYKERTLRLLGEVARVLDGDGQVVVRETVTPQIADLTDGMLGVVGLKKDGIVTPDMKVWQPLEATYDGRHVDDDLEEYFNPKSFYQFLSKASLL